MVDTTDLMKVDQKADEMADSSDLSKAVGTAARSVESWAQQMAASKAYSMVAETVCTKTAR